MTTREENDLLTHTGRGTPMGDLMRRFWLPALLSRELEADGAPLRVRLLGENLVAFRNTEGKVGLLRENCAHRGASLYFAKNEECGLRCLYHGWKYDIDGNCLDQPNEPPQTQFKDKVKQPAYPCIERNGIVMTYMGPPEKKPPLPEFEWLTVPESHVYISKRYQDCHWLQGMEGDIDSSHLGFLHGIEAMKQGDRARHGRLFDARRRRHLSEARDRAQGQHDRAGRAARCRSAASLLAHRRLADAVLHRAAGLPADAALGGHAWVPVDDTKVWAFGISWHPKRPLTSQERNGSMTARRPASIRP